MSEATFDPTKFNKSDNPPFSSILANKAKRRDVVKGGSALAALSMLSTFGLGVGCGGGGSNNNESSDSTLSFKSIAGSLTDGVAVAEGYTAQVLAPWGTPLNDDASEWQNDGSNTPTDQQNSVGQNHDGIYYFPLNGSSTNGILAMNHEYLNSELWADGEDADSADYMRKGIYAHGVSVMEIQLNGSTWEIVEGSQYNRRIHGQSPMDISGPVTASNFITKWSTDGSQARGTFNNCGSGASPWGTFLTCEENWPNYFVVATADMTTDQERLGLNDIDNDTDSRYRWEVAAGDATEVDDEFTRFNVSQTGATATDDYRNEANGHGYVVEIDPYDPNSTPVKRTALGRFRHECVVYGKLVEGEPVCWYSGHDGRFEYLYKFVSDENWDPADADPTDRLATGSKYLDSGTLYVAQFNENGGEWLPLNTSNTDLTSFSSLDEIILNTPGAADEAGGTPMDRPEWIAVDPITGSVYLTLTNNTQRTGDSDDTQADFANPRLNNSYGHIIRWDDTAGSTSFTWDIFVYGSPAEGTTDGDDADINRSGLQELNQFASPDGLVFDNRGIMWIQTDNGADAVEEYTNDQMLAVIPSQLTNSNGDPAVITSDNQDQLLRFFVGPNGCEVTGCAITPDNTTFFINIQHPGNWPAYTTDDATEVVNGTVRARSATVVVRKTDGGAIGV